MDLYTERKDVEYLAYLSSQDEIVKNEYNLSVSTYVEAEDTREVIDIKVLNQKLDDLVIHEAEMRNQIKTIISGIEVDYE